MTSVSLAARSERRKTTAARLDQWTNLAGEDIVGLPGAQAAVMFDQQVEQKVGVYRIVLAAATERGGLPHAQSEK